MTGSEPNTVEAVLKIIADMDRDQLVARWEAVFGCPAPRHSQAPLLRGALAWQFQMALAKGSPARGTARLVQTLRRAGRAAQAATGPAPGTRLVREWQGQTHHVLVLSDGFEYNGARHRSLTAIARQITGTAWSGPLFFGLRP